MEVKMKRRLIACVLAGVMAAATAACGREIPVDESTGEESEATEQNDGKLEPEDGAKLIFWTMDTEYGEAAAQRFEELSGVEVQIEAIGLDGIEKIMLDGPSGNGADLFMVAHDQFQVGYTAGVYKELDTQISNKLQEEISDVALKTVERDGKLYGVPVSIETNALFFNKDLVEDPANEFEQMMEEALDYNKPPQNKFWFLMSPSGGYAVYPFLTSFGFELFGAAGTDDENPGFDTPEYLEGLKFLAELKKYMPISSEDLRGEAVAFVDQNFIDGNTAYYPSGPWTVKALEDAGVNFGVSKLPTVQGNVMKPFAGVQNLHVSAYSEYPKAAQLFAEFLVSEEGASLLYEKAGKITSRADVSEVEGLSDDENMKVFVEQFQDAVPMPAAKRISYYWTISENVFGAVFDGKITPEEGAKKAQEDFEALVESE